MVNPSSSRYRHLEKDLDSRLRALEGSWPPDPRVRGLALAAAATASGEPEAVRAVLRLTLGREIGVEELREVLLQTYLFCGYPRAINALAELAAQHPGPLGEPHLDLGSESDRGPVWLSRGQNLCRQVHGEAYDALLRSMARISPDLGRWMVVEGYGKVLSRPGLDPRTRELAAVAALLPLEVPEQLRAHLRGCFLVGASRAEIAGALETAALLTPKLLGAAKRILGEVARKFDRGT